MTTTLQHYLDAWAGKNPLTNAVKQTVLAIAATAIELSFLIAQGPLAGEMGRIIGPSADGDGQKWLDRQANDLFIERLGQAGVYAIASEELPAALVLDPSGSVAVAIDPLDGSNNIDVNAPMGTVFSLLPAAATPEQTFLIPGTDQLAAGFLLYGPYTALALTMRDGVSIFTLDPGTQQFQLTRPAVSIPPARREYAINASNARHWPLPVRAFVEECIAGGEGPRGADYNTRWLGAVVAETFRILCRGGIYLYPGDSRPGYHRGRLRLLFEANPIALLIEQAGGTAIDGFHRILELVPSDLQEHAPLIFGSADKVERVMNMYAQSVPQAGPRPLFSTRGLFKY
jgi:fructose-1,6-bisphosphatase I